LLAGSADAFTGNVRPSRAMRQRTLNAHRGNDNEVAQSVFAVAFAAAALVFDPTSSMALRDVVANQPDIPDKIVPGKTTLKTDGPTDIIGGQDVFSLDFAGKKPQWLKDDAKPKFEAPAMPEFKAPEMPKFEMPKIDIPAPAPAPAPKPVSKPAPEMPKFEAPAMPEFKAPEMPKFEMPKIDIPAPAPAPAPKPASKPAPEMPKFEAPAMPEFKAPEMPKFEMPKIDIPVPAPAPAPKPASKPAPAPVPELPKFEFKAPEVPSFGGVGGGGAVLEAPKAAPVALPPKPVVSDEEKQAAKEAEAIAKAKAKEAEAIAKAEAKSAQAVTDAVAKEAATEFKERDSAATEAEKKAAALRADANEAKKIAKEKKDIACETRFGGKFLCIRPLDSGY